MTNNESLGDKIRKRAAEQAVRQENAAAAALRAEQALELQRQSERQIAEQKSVVLSKAHLAIAALALEAAATYLDIGLETDVEVKNGVVRRGVFRKHYGSTLLTGWRLAENKETYQAQAFDRDIGTYTKNRTRVNGLCLAKNGKIFKYSYGLSDPSYAFPGPSRSSQNESQGELRAEDLTRFGPVDFAAEKPEDRILEFWGGLLVKPASHVKPIAP